MSCSNDHPKRTEFDETVTAELASLVVTVNGRDPGATITDLGNGQVRIQIAAGDIDCPDPGEDGEIRVSDKSGLVKCWNITGC